MKTDKINSIYCCTGVPELNYRSTIFSGCGISGNSNFQKDLKETPDYITHHPPFSFLSIVIPLGFSVGKY
jgi:hypothetical protein